MNATPATIEQLLQIAATVDRLNVPQYCAVPNCARDHIGLRLCRAHYLQLWKWRKKTGNQDRLPYQFEQVAAYEQPLKYRGITTSERRCHVPNCDREYQARGYCNRHYLMWYRSQKRDQKDAN